MTIQGASFIGYKLPPGTRSFADIPTKLLSLAPQSLSTSMVFVPLNEASSILIWRKSMQKLMISVLLLTGIACKPQVSFQEPCTDTFVKGRESGVYRRANREYIRVTYKSRNYYLDDGRARPLGFNCFDALWSDIKPRQPDIFDSLATESQTQKADTISGTHRQRQE
jgi:hypothetical protein